MVSYSVYQITPKFAFDNLQRVLVKIHGDQFYPDIMKWTVLLNLQNASAAATALLSFCFYQH